MSLDTLEIVIGIEDEFSIQFPYERFSEARTVGDLCAVVASLLHPSGSPVCRNIPAFCTLRRGLVALGRERHQIRPAVALRALLPMDDRREAWARLSAITGYRLPDLKRSPGLVSALVLLPILALAWLFLAFRAWPPAVGVFILLLVLLPAYAMLAARLTVPLAIEFPSGCGTVGGLIRDVIRWNDVRAAVDPPHPPAVELFPRIRRIVAENLNIPEQEISEFSRFLEDLGVG